MEKADGLKRWQVSFLDHPEIIASTLTRNHLHPPHSPNMASSDQSKTTSNIIKLRDLPRFHEQFALPREDQHDVEPAWFERRKQRSVQKNDPSLRDWLVKQVDALEAFHDGHLKAEDAASAMTHPLSVSPVPELGGYSDEVLAVCNLWRVLIEAVMEWPSARLPELFALLDAIGKAPGDIHNGEAADDEGEKLTWAQFPYFGFSWHERTSADFEPGQICRQYSDSASLALARNLYLKQKEIEAQLVGAHVMSLNYRMIYRIIWTLEKNIDQSDEMVATDEATASDQIKLDWHIPAVEFMFRYNERRIYERVVTQGLAGWTKGQVAALPKQFQSGAERWALWRRRLEELSNGHANDEVKAAAQASLGYMSQE
jgi:hypothetical protein